MKKSVRWILIAVAVILVCALVGAFGWKWYDSHVDRSGWDEETGVRRYRDFHGQTVTGWLDIDGSRYYFGVDGAVSTYWQDIDGQRYYFGENGAMATGWLDTDAGRFFLDGSGAMTTGWQEVGGTRYYLDETGVLQTGWLELEDGRYYLNGDGTPVTGWQDIDGQRRCFDGSGLLHLGWLEQDGCRYYLDENGAVTTGWQDIDGQRYYFSQDGTAYTGWLQEGEYSYYLRDDGSAAVGPTEIEGQTYYFSPSGVHIWLVNPWNYLHEDYEVDLVAVESGYRVATICEGALRQMLADCRAAGNYPSICSGYRSYWDQVWLFNNKIEEYGWTVGKQIVAVPNTSEHQLGLAVDIVESSDRNLSSSQAHNPAQQWLMEHCWEYGFILRYPDGTSEITGIIYEPWHYRYVGLEVALELQDLGITLEEYLGATDHE